jgi:hypothetical protein
MPRAEPCPIPGCDHFKFAGKPFCRDHWRALNTFWRCLLVRYLNHMRDADRDGDRDKFRSFARQFEYARDRAAEIITNKEGIDASA